MLKKKFIPQLALKLTKKNAILLAITALAFYASPGSRADADCLLSVNSGSGTATIEGTVAPDWTLTISGDLTFLSINGNTPTMQCSVTPSNLGSVDAEVSGAATLDGKLSVIMTGNFTPGTRFTLLHSQGALTQQFSSQSITYPTNQGFTPKIIYDYVGNHVYLCLVPTAGTACN